VGSGTIGSAAPGLIAAGGRTVRCREFARDPAGASASVNTAIRPAIRTALAKIPIVQPSFC
jgi:hypothetical protein